MGDAEAQLAQEYLALQKMIEDYDSKSLTIKAWSLTLGMGGLGLAVTQKATILLLVSGLAAATFWVVEALWKVNQQAYYARIDELEEHFAGGKRQAPFQIGRSWKAAFVADGLYWLSLKIMWWPHISLPYAIIILAAILLALAT